MRGPTIRRDEMIEVTNVGEDSNTVYTMRDLRTKAGRLNNARTTKLINVRTGKVLIEVIGYATKGDVHIAFLNEKTKQAAELLKG